MAKESRRVRGITGVLVLVWLAGPAFAESNDMAARVERLEQTILAQQDEISDLRDRVDQAGGADSGIATERSTLYPSRGWLGSFAYGDQDITVDVHGFINFEFVDAGPDGARGGVSTFDGHHANLFFDVLLRENLRSHIEVEFEHGGDSIEIDQAFVSWGVTDWLTIDAGRFYAPFGIERFNWYGPVNKFVSRPLPFRQIIPGNFYQEGVKVSGDIKISEEFRVTYEGSLSNGLSSLADTSRRSSRQTRDDNNNKALTGRVAAVLWPWVEVGASIHSQKYGADQDLTFIGLDLAARWQGFELRTEYVTADLDRPVIDDLGQDGWYSQLSYRFDLEREMLKSLTVAARFDQIDLDDDLTGNDDQRRWSLGTNFEIYEHFHAKLEYQLASESGTSLNNNAWLAAVVVDF